MRRLKLIGLYLMAAFYLFTGVSHLLKTEGFIKVIPPFLPWPYAIAILSGVAEIFLAIGLLPKKTRRWAAWGIIALLICVFPANVYMYLARDTKFTEFPAWALLIRLPLQIVLIAWAYVYSRAASAESSACSAA